MTAVVPWWAATGLIVLVLIAAGSITLSAVAINRLNTRLKHVEQQTCQLYAHLHMAIPPGC